MRKKRTQKWRAAAFSLAVALAAGGCGESTPMASEEEVVEGYTDAQIRLVVATERYPSRSTSWGRCGISLRK